MRTTSTCFARFSCFLEMQLEYLWKQRLLFASLRVHIQDCVEGLRLHALYHDQVVSSVEPRLDLKGNVWREENLILRCIQREVLRKKVRVRSKIRSNSGLEKS